MKTQWTNLKWILIGILGLITAACSNQPPTAKAEFSPISLGPRPFYLIDQMTASELKETLQSCQKNALHRRSFSIGHRGAPLQFPEHTRESYLAAARMGAGTLECDVTFTRDKQLVCRHSQCDLHTTTNILASPLAKKCSTPFQPARFDKHGKLVQAASAKCCTSDFTLEEFRQLKGKMDGANPYATSIEAFLKGTPRWRTDLYATQGTLMTHRDSIELFDQLGVDMTPELKSPQVEMPFQGFDQHAFASKLIQEYEDAGIDPERVWPQSFHYKDVLYWLRQHPQFGRQAVMLEGRYAREGFDHRDPNSWSPSMEELNAAGVSILAPPLWMLIESKDDQLVPSAYSRAAKKAGLKLIGWTLERSGPLNKGGGWYYQDLNGINSDGRVFELLHVLAQDVGVRGVFSDWPAAVTYYANCFELP